jgi:hypothetical protein
VKLLKRTINPEALWIAIGRDCSEFALLWLVFSILDRLVNERLTVTWLVALNIVPCDLDHRLVY